MADLPGHLILRSNSCNMKYHCLPLALFLCVAFSRLQAQNADLQTIRNIMADQEAAWNAGDLPRFMAGYWQSDSLTFIGSRGLTHGWQTTLDNYKKSYPDAEAMGKLTFTLLTVEQLSPTSAYVIGKWQLARIKGDLSGHFTLLWKKIEGAWVIVADHSS